MDTGLVWVHHKTGNLYRVVRVKRVKHENVWSDDWIYEYQQMYPNGEDQVDKDTGIQVRYEAPKSDFLARFSKYEGEL